MEVQSTDQSCPACSMDTGNVLPVLGAGGHTVVRSTLGVSIPPALDTAGQSTAAQESTRGAVAQSAAESLAPSSAPPSSSPATGSVPVSEAGGHTVVRSSQGGLTPAATVAASGGQDPTIAAIASGSSPDSSVEPALGDHSGSGPAAPRSQDWAVQTQVADLGQRFLAQLIDGLVGAALFVIWLLVMFALVRVGQQISYGLANLLSIIGSLGNLFIVFGTLVAYAVTTGRIGQTPGKGMLGIQVADADTGSPIGVGRGFLRWLVFVAMGLPCYLGYVSFFTDNTGRNRAWHDHAASDVVLRVQPVSFGRSIQNFAAALRSS